MRVLEKQVDTGKTQDEGHPSLHQITERYAALAYFLHLLRGDDESEHGQSDLHYAIETEYRDPCRKAACPYGRKKQEEPDNGPDCGNNK